MKTLIYVQVTSSDTIGRVGDRRHFSVCQRFLAIGPASRTNNSFQSYVRGSAIDRK